MEINKKQNAPILLVATVSYAGMLPYASTIINAMKDQNIYCVLVNSKFGDYRKTIDASLHDRCYFYEQGENKFLNQVEFLFPSNVPNIIEKVCRGRGIKSIHLLTNDPSLSHFVVKWKNKMSFYFTVHDLIQHEENVSFLLGWKRKIQHSRMNKIINCVHHLSTNSREQFNALRKSYPNKQITYFPFPTLITDAIENGDQVLPELKGIKNYILFFGRIEKYKGLDLLIEVFKANKDLQQKYQLVIAGRGNLGAGINHDRIIFINRYIHDNEVRVLFENAYCTVYPYISATQSGVLSLSYYFGKLAIVSDIDFFKENIIENETGISFENGRMDGLLDAFRRIEKLNLNSYKENIKRYYQELYSLNSLESHIKGMYEIPNY